MVIEWSVLHCSFAQEVNTKELIILDSDSTDTVFCNPKYVLNIQDLDHPLSINKNEDIMKSHQKCNIRYVNNVWHNKNSITNIISMTDMTEKLCITMDLKEKLALLVHIPNKILKFNQFSNILYSMDPKN